MDIEIIIFGQLAELTGTAKVTLEQVNDTDELVNRLQQKYPLLAGKAYAVAVDKQLINENTTLHAGATVALLPPFSGG